jgi:UDP-N-acetylglucosamine transferase subunit ALG13
MAACLRAYGRNLCRISPLIFVTVGTQLPFPRLTRFMASWAACHDEKVIMQTGDTVSFSGCVTYGSIGGLRFTELVRTARVVVSHAGIGSVLAAKDLGKPIILVPRRGSLGEHRNDHQVATAVSLEGRRGLRVAWEIDDVPSFLDEAIEPPNMEVGLGYDGLVQRVRDFVTV